ncbi:Ldh family oxidoreductase [Arthrobacter tumbae]|uniref:Ldh family oxidoreductase n=1 Tax=Arthrobacter tumbae TaxID=163874 RepID=UPI0019580812|nr:Ldh family oxidoreductase [Arthrobacter tumbae]MBM7780888.1 LDH2 family malate/lactate/ureidoglycolate dehydrogenase [Arthrobacter tumbae]
MKQYSADTVREQILAVLHAWGMAPERAEITAEVMVDTDLAGIDSHGISMLPMYQRLIDAGKLDARAEAMIEREGSSTAVVDGGHNLGHSAMVTAMQLAVSKARETGVGVVTVRRSHHFGSAGYYARIAADAGQIGLVTSTTPTKTVVPTRGSRPVLGTNPLAFAAPTANAAEPFLLDMSTSTVAMNKVKVYDYLDKPLPAGWVLDGAGRPVTDSRAGYSQLRDQQEGGLSPLGGTEQLSSHKGYGLALMVQILAGALAGATFAPLREPSDPNDIGHFCLAIDPAFFGEPEQFAASVSQIVDLLRAEPPASPDRPVLVPGDIERTVRAERLGSGIPLSDGLVGHIRDICAQNEAPFHL